LESVEKRESVGGELFDTVRASGCGRDAVAAGVVAENAKVLCKCGDLRIPHTVGGAQRVGKENYGSVGGAFELEMDLGSGHIGCGQSEISSMAILPRAISARWRIERLRRGLDRRSHRYFQNSCSLRKDGQARVGEVFR